MFPITCITNDADNRAQFAIIDYPQHDRNGLHLSEQIRAKNFRLRESLPDYQTDWHCTPEPTMIIICSGVLRISLPNGIFQDFRAGDIFIAADTLPADISFIDGFHGHKAEVVGEAALSAVHIKLDNWANSF